MASGGKSFVSRIGFVAILPVSPVTALLSFSLFSLSFSLAYAISIFSPLI